MVMNNSLVYIGFAFEHHKGTHAGYHHIKEYVNYDYVIDTQRYVEMCSISNPSIFKKVWRKILKIEYILKCVCLALCKGNVIFHFIYGENNYVNNPLLHLRGCKVIVTFHQPFSWFKENQKWLGKLNKIDEIILVGKAEIDLFNSVTGKDNVRFFPHGICADFYSPNSTIQMENMVLMVGNWLRDFSFASRIFKRLAQVSPATKVVVVTNKKNAHFFKENINVNVLSGISDEELRDLYRKTSCLFLPLERYTANNALLEAGAVGCNILIASNHADNSYIPDKYIDICPLDENLAFKKLLEVMKRMPNINLAEFVRQRYSWESVGNQVEKYLKNSNKK